MALARSLFRIWISPILWRELRSFLRSTKSFVFFFLFLVGVNYLVSQNWGAFASAWAPDGDIPQGARALFYTLAKGHLFFITIVTPLLMAPVIVEERERSTLDTLLSSPISVSHFVFSKLLSPLIYLFILLISGIPILSLCFLGGGLSFYEVSRTYLILFTATFTMGCLGLFCSTLRKRVYEVYLIAVIATFFSSFLIPYHGSAWHYFSTLKWTDFGLQDHGFQYISPFFTLREEFYPSAALKNGVSILYDPSELIRSGTLKPMGLPMVLKHYIMLSFVLCIVLLWATTRRVRSIVLGVTEEWGRSLEEEDDSQIYDRDYDISFNKTSEEGNPGLVLERRVQWFARLPVVMRLFYTALITSVLTLPLASYEGSWLFFSLPFLIASLFTLPLAATSISADRDRGLLDLVRTSLLSSDQIVRAKFMTNLQYNFFIALALYLPGMLLQLTCGLLGYEVDLVSNVRDTFAILFYPFILLCALLVYTAFGLYCSACFRQTNRALIVSSLVIFVTIIAPFLFSTTNSPPGFGILLLALISPLAGVTSLFPSEQVNILGRNLLPFQEGIGPYFFVALQCGVCLYLTQLLIARAANRLADQD